MQSDVEVKFVLVYDSGSETDESSHLCQGTTNRLVFYHNQRVVFVAVVKRYNVYNGTRF